MDRRNNMKAFERGVSALMDAGIRVKVDLIIGLPGDTVASVRRGFGYLASNKLFNVLETPTLPSIDLYDLMADAQEVFETEWDPFPEPKLHFDGSSDQIECLRIDLDQDRSELPPAEKRAQALTLWFKSKRLNEHVNEM